MAFTRVNGTASNIISHSTGKKIGTITPYFYYEQTYPSQTVCQFKFYAGVKCQYTGTGTSITRHPYVWFTSTNSSINNKKSDKSITITKTATDTTIISTLTFNVTRKTTAQSFQVALNFNFEDGGGSISPKTFTISALPSYTITYDANGGSGGGTQTKYYGVSVNLWPGSRFTRTGYQPENYYQRKDGTGKTIASTTYYEFNQSWNGNENIKLYVSWIPDGAIIYHANGGINAPNQQVKPYNIAVTLSSQKPTRENYTFLGWAYSQERADNGIVDFLPGGVVPKDYTDLDLYAVWRLDAALRTLYKLDLNNKYIEYQEYVPIQTKVVSGNSIENKFTFLGWMLDSPSKVIYPVGTTAQEIGALTEINAGMSNVFYAVYEDASPSTLHKIYDSTVFPNIIFDSEGEKTLDEVISEEFDMYETTILNGNFYNNIASYNNSDINTLFGYIECNETIELDDIEGTISDCSGGNPISQNINLMVPPVETVVNITQIPIQFGYFKIQFNVVDLYFIGGVSDTKTYTNTYNINGTTHEITLTTIYNAENNTIAFYIDEDIDYIVAQKLIYNSLIISPLEDIDLSPVSPTAPTGFFRQIRIVDKYIFFMISNPGIIPSSKHTITFTGIDLQNKRVTFVIENKIKVPLIDIKPYTIEKTTKLDDFPSIDIKNTRLIHTNNQPMSVNNRYSNTYISCRREANPNSEISFGIGSGGENRGLWLHSKISKIGETGDSGGWLIYSDANGVTHLPASDIRLAGHSSGIGTIEEKYLTSATPVNSGVWQTIGQVTLGPGVWIIYMSAQWSTQGSGYYSGFCVVGLTTSSTGDGWDCAEFYPCGQNINYRVNAMTIKHLDATTTFYCRARQTTGGTQTMPAGAANGGNRICAVRIK